MYDHIVVAIDGGKASDLALREALKLAKDQHTKLILVHVADLSFAGEGGMWIGLPDYLQSIRDAARLLMEMSEKKAKKEGVEVESHIIEMIGSDDRIAEHILSITKRLKGDLLVLGTHGRSGFRRFLLGSVAEEIIRIATLPILLIRGPESV